MSKMITVTCQCGRPRTTNTQNLNKTNKCKYCFKQITYNELLDKLPTLTILTTEQEWNLTSKTGKERIKVICTAKGCNNKADMLINNYKYLTQRCPKCVNGYSYHEVLDKISDITVLTTEEEWNNTLQTGGVPIKIKCIIDDCNNETTIKLNFVKYHTNKCTVCINKVSYKELDGIMKNSTILTTEQEWNKTTMTTTEKIKIKCTNNNCNNAKIIRIQDRNRISSLCLPCVHKNTSTTMTNLQNDANGNSFNIFHAYDTELFDKLYDILKNNFIIKKTNDGCKCDIYFKPINIEDDKWLQIQMKSSKKIGTPYKFTMNNIIYTDMLILLHQFVANKYWLINGNNLPSISGITIRNNSKYNDYLTNETNFIGLFTSYYNTMKLFDENTILSQLNKTHSIEHTHRQKRENLLKNHFIFEYPKIDGSIFDVLIDNLKVQDKTGTAIISNKTTAFAFKIKRSFKGKNWYDKMDNDFYWLHNNINSMFLVIPTSKLENYGYIKDKNNPDKNLKSSFSINFKNYKNHIFADYVFDYDKLDITKLKNLIK